MRADHGRLDVLVNDIWGTGSIGKRHRRTVFRDIGTQARAVLSEGFGQPVHLDLQVKVRPRWRRDDAMLDRLGL